MDDRSPETVGTTARPASEPPVGARVELAIDGMHCGSCAALIEEVLCEQPGVESASVDLDDARAFVAFDPALLGVDELRSLVAAAGYGATPVA